jgi:hypothetical protein
MMRVVAEYFERPAIFKTCPERLDEAKRKGQMERQSH